MNLLRGSKSNSRWKDDLIWLVQMNVVEGEPCLSVKAAQLKQPTSVFYSMATLLDNTSQNRMRAKSKKGRGGNYCYDSNKDTKQWKLVRKPTDSDSQITQRQMQPSSGVMLTLHTSLQTESRER